MFAHTRLPEASAPRLQNGGALSQAVLVTDTVLLSIYDSNSLLRKNGDGQQRLHTPRPTCAHADTADMTAISTGTLGGLQSLFQSTSYGIGSITRQDGKNLAYGQRHGVCFL